MSMLENGEQKWFQKFCVGYIKNYILLVIKAADMVTPESRAIRKKEEERRDELIDIMRKTKQEYHINDRIEKGVGVGTKRMDIAFLPPNVSERIYVCFECKRFLKENMNSSYFRREYVNEGIWRFQKGYYADNMPEVGMLAFLETGDFLKLNELFEKELPKQSDTPIGDASDIYGHEYVYETKHLRDIDKSRFSITHILTDFTSGL